MIATIFVVVGTILYVGGLIRSVVVIGKDYEYLFWPWISVALSGILLQLVGIGMFSS